MEQMGYDAANGGADLHRLPPDPDRTRTYAVQAECRIARMSSFFVILLRPSMSSSCAMS